MSPVLCSSFLLCLWPFSGILFLLPKIDIEELLRWGSVWHTLHLYLSKNVFISLTLWKYFLAEYKILCCPLFPFGTLKASFPISFFPWLRCQLSFKFHSLKGILSFVPSWLLLRFFSLPFVFSISNTMCLGMDFFYSPEVSWNSWIAEAVSFTSSWIFAVIITSETIPVPYPFLWFQLNTG